VKTKADINVVTMGCSKNLVDSERLMRQLTAAGYAVVHDAVTDSAAVVIINTCGFIGAFIVQTQLSEPASK